MIEQKFRNVSSLLFLQHILEILQVSAHAFNKNKASAADIFNITAGPFSVCVCDPSKTLCSKLTLTTHSMK